MGIRLHEGRQVLGFVRWGNCSRALRSARTAPRIFRHLRRDAQRPVHFRAVESVHVTSDAGALEVEHSVFWDVLAYAKRDGFRPFLNTTALFPRWPPGAQYVRYPNNHSKRRWRRMDTDDLAAHGATFSASTGSGLSQADWPNGSGSCDSGAPKRTHFEVASPCPVPLARVPS